MNNKTKYLLKNTGILTISNFATKIISFLLVPLYTEILSTFEYGSYDLITASVGFIFPILSLNIVDAIMRFSLDSSQSKNDIGKIGLIYVLRSNIIVSFAILALYLFDVFPALNEIYGLAILYYFFSSFYTYLIQFAKGCENVKTLGISGVLGTIIIIIFNIIFLVVLKLGIMGMFWASIITQAINCGYLGVKLSLFTRIKEGKYNRDLEKQMLLYCIPLIATTLGWWINNASDKYIVAFYLGASANGILAISYKLPTIINTLQSIFIQAWQISAIKEYGTEDASGFYGNVFSKINLMMCASCSWLIILAIPIAKLLFAKDFFDAWRYSPFLIISSVMNSASGLLGPILSARKNSKALALSAVYGATANIVLNIILVYYLGIQGATIATLISSFIIFIVRKFAVGNDIKIRNNSIIVITWVMLCVQAFIEIYINNYIVQIVLMMLMLLMNWNEVHQIGATFVRAIKNGKRGFSNPL